MGRCRFSKKADSLGWVAQLVEHEVLKKSRCRWFKSNPVHYVSSQLAQLVEQSA